MLIRILAALFMFATSNVQALDATRLMPALTWEKRVLLIFVPDQDHAGLRRQVSLLDAADAGLPERDISVIKVFADGRVAFDAEMRADSAAGFYRLFEVERNEFRVILVGKDGTVKLDRDNPVSGDDLFRLIDAMPMRRMEMQQDG